MAAVLLQTAALCISSSSQAAAPVNRPYHLSATETAVIKKVVAENLASPAAPEFSSIAATIDEQDTVFVCGLVAETGQVVGSHASSIPFLGLLAPGNPPFFRVFGELGDRDARTEAVTSKCRGKGIEFR